MGIPERITDILAGNVNDLIDKAEDPVKTARQLIREMDDEIILLRSRVRAQENRVERSQRQLEKKRDEAGEWQARAERAVDEGKDNAGRVALKRKRELEEEVRNLELSWWEASQEKSILDEQLRKLEDQVQATRRCKESLVAKRRRGRSSSDFIPVVREELPASETKVVAALEIEEELKRLKEERKD